MTFSRKEMLLGNLPFNHANDVEILFCRVKKDVMMEILLIQMDVLPRVKLSLHTFAAIFSCPLNAQNVEIRKELEEEKYVMMSSH